MAESNHLTEFGEKFRAFYAREVEPLCGADANRVHLLENKLELHGSPFLSFKFEERTPSGQVVSHGYFNAFADAYCLDGTIGVRATSPGSKFQGDLETRALELLHSFLATEGFEEVSEPSNSPLPNICFGPDIDTHYAKRL